MINFKETQNGECLQPMGFSLLVKFKILEMEVEDWKYFLTCLQSHLVYP